VVEETNFVARGLPFQHAPEVVTNPAPVTVSVAEELPTSTVSGLSVETTGTGSRTVNVDVAELPPPGGMEFTMATPAVRAAARS
jgi:hypothetical protein